MDYRVVFSPTSIRDLADSVAYIARHDTNAAVSVGDGLIDGGSVAIERSCVTSR